jgi:exopolyphosphatase/guanosine-5'-triphosphate,3'-diphosphate pyrophosphatase
MVEITLNRNTDSNLPETIAAIDLGTTTCRLLIAKVTEGGPQVVDSYVRVLRLGDELATKGHISKEASLRAISALKVCAEKINTHNVSRMRCVATAACRTASNREEFLNTIQKNTGLELEVISTAEEARLAIVGCADLLDSSTRYALAFDIGGGSTEVMWMELLPNRLPEIIEWTSLPLGVVTVAETLRSEPSSMEFLGKIRKAVSQEMKAFSDKAFIYPQLRKNNVQMIGTSGTVTTLAALNMNLDKYDRSQVNGIKLNPESIKRTISTIYGMTTNERLLHPCIGPMRADLVMGGVAIFEGIYDVFPIDPVRVADRGVREGILVDLLKR